MTSFKHNWGSSNEIDRKKERGVGKVGLQRKCLHTNRIILFVFARDYTISMTFSWEVDRYRVTLAVILVGLWRGKVTGSLKCMITITIWYCLILFQVWIKRKKIQKKKKKIQQSLNNSSTIDRLNPVDGDLSISFSPSLIMSSPPKKWFLFKTKKTYSNYFFFRVFWSCVFIVYSSQSIARARVCECVCLCV